MKLFEIFSDPPLMTRIVGTEGEIMGFIKTFEQLLAETKSVGLITIEKAKAIWYKAGK